MSKHSFQSTFKVVRRTATLKAGHWLKSVTILITCVIPLGAAAEECRLTVLGDSLTAGYGVTEADAFPSQLSRALEAAGQPCEVINAGVSGDTSAGGAARIDWVLAEEPTHILVELGGNDGLRALPTSQLQNNLEAIVSKAQSADVEVMLAGMLAPPNLGPQYGEAFAGVFQSVATAFDLDFYPFFLEGVIANPSLLIEDGIHPNADGVARIVDGILPQVIEFLSSR